MASKLSMTDVLRRAIRESGLPFQALERETGVQRRCICRFLNGEQSIRLDMADKLAAYFKLVLTAETPRK